MTHEEYWKQRQVEVAQRQYELSAEKMTKQLKAIYENMNEVMAREVDAIWFKLLEDDLKRTDIWTYKHYRDLSKRMAVMAAQVGVKEERIFNIELEHALKEIYKDTPTSGASFNLIDETLIKQIIATPWSEKHFNQAIWYNKTKMLEILKKGITKSIVLGESKDKTVVKLRDLILSTNKDKGFKGAFADADRLVRTELMHVINQGQKQRYKDNGYTRLEIVVAEDERTCERCSGLQGKIVSLEEDILPVHPRCRCTYIPVVEWRRENETQQDVGVSTSATEQSTATNKRGEEIKFDLGSMKESSQERVKEIISKLSYEYHTELRQVIKASGKAAGSVNVGFTMKLANIQPKTIYHEFAHSLTLTDADKLKLTDNSDFWKAIKKIRRAYTKDVFDNPKLSISAYSHANVDEFMAEAFTQAKLRGTDLLGEEYGKDYTYSTKVLEIIDKYFKK